MAYVMYLIPGVIRDRLELIRELRNLFAHTQVPTDFRDARLGEILQILSSGEVKATVPAQEAKHVVSVRPTPSSIRWPASARCLHHEGGICDAPSETGSEEGSILAAGDRQAAE